MSERIDRFLQPISSDLPCGPDLSNSQAFADWKATLQGKPEVEIGRMLKPAEPPNWNVLAKQSEALLAQTKHLYVAVVACGCWLQQDGIRGFHDGLTLIRKLLEGYWGALWPQLDPEDGNDPTTRLNILRTLTTGRGSITGWLRFVDFLYAAPLARLKNAPPIAFAHILAARKSEAEADENAGAGSTLSKVEAAFRSLPAEEIAASREALEGALDAGKGIDQFLTATLGSRESISFEVLDGVLNELLAAVSPYLPGVSPDAVATTAAASGVSVAIKEQTATFAVSGAIRSRDDVIRALEGICAYYRQVEPGSPVPFLLLRAQKLAAMNFVEAMQELDLATIEKLRPSMGSALPAPPPT